MTKSLGIALVTLGTIVVAIRVKYILDAIHVSLSAHDLNIQQLMIGRTTLINIVGTDKTVENAQKIGAKLLYLGFGLIVLGNGFAISSLWQK